ncbi:MAG: threonine/homoserine/homoserine lactone efflux protein [Planctomycetota bacterium]|jgi:threonine/homoserine/homoserine lactone efflux protein
MSLTAWLSLVGICCAGAISPGPSLVLILRQTISLSTKHGLASAWGHACGIGLYASAAALGLGALMKTNPTIANGIQWGGAAYLIWLGVKALRSAGGTAAALELKREPTLILTAAKEGLGIAVVNPKIILFFAAIFSQFVEIDMSAQGVAIMVATASIIDGVWYSIVVLGLSRTRLIDVLRKNAIWADRLMGTILITVAIIVLFS